MAAERFDCVVIGGGMSGLAAAIRLARYHGRVCLVERNPNLGGLNTCYRRAGRVLESGLHAMTNFAAPGGARSAPLSRLLRQLRIGLDELALRPQTGSEIRFPGAALRFTNDFAVLAAEVARAFPAAAGRFHAFDRVLSGFDALSAGRPRLSARAAAAEALQEPLLEDMLFCPLMYYGSATPDDMDLGQFAIMWQSVFKEGFCRPAGGVAALLSLLEGKAREAGCELLRPREVTAILVEGGRAAGVRLDDGAELRAAAILSSIGMPETLALCDPPPPPDERGAFPPGALAFLELMAAFQPGTPGTEGGETILFINRAPRFAFHAPDGLLSLESAVVCRPLNFQWRAGDPRPEPMLRVTALAGYDAWRALGAEAYAAGKARAAAALLSLGAEACGGAPAPGEAVYTELFTPLTVERFTRRARGAVYGSPAKRLDGRTHLPNLFVCGTDQGFLGIVGAMLSGVTIANARVLRGASAL